LKITDACWQPRVSKRCGVIHPAIGRRPENEDCFSTVWLWWSERNAVGEGERRRTASDLAFVVHKLSDEFIALHKKDAAVPNNARKQWAKPPNDWLKVNSDRAFFARLGEGSWGYVIY
jgi:hypothetical protein